MNRILQEANRRRVFAIISHPDAGKTTVTEKMLLYGGAKELAGSVTAKKNQRDTSSDWMELEKKRGISVSSTLLQFEYGGYRLNLLDTPGHRDFSEDTYRVLSAVDAVIMVIDAGKGIESQTRKLFELCSKRGIPIFTFMNKLDRPALPPLQLIDELEEVLKIHAVPVNWPLGSGPAFKGIYNRSSRKVHLFEKTPGGSFRSAVTTHGITDPQVQQLLDDESYQQITEEIELLDEVQQSFDPAEVLAGKTTPVFFGSAVNNFGLQLLLDGFLAHSAPPTPRCIDGKEIPLDHPDFSGFIFKIQTNMNPQHRDRMVFARICSGRFERAMKVHNTRSGKSVRLSSAHNLFGRDRETVDEAFPGDILGFITNAEFRIGDTVSESDPELVYHEIPRFAPECFAWIRGTALSANKTFRKGLDHLLAEDIVQGFYLENQSDPLPLLGAVGPLQFEVLQHRLKNEYGVETRLETGNWEVLRWVDPASVAGQPRLPSGSAVGKDDLGRTVYLFPSEWMMNYFLQNNPETRLLDTPPPAAV